MKWRDRVKELARVRADQIANAPWNYREHPDGQKTALVGSIEELGFFSPLEVWEPEPGKYMLIDGEARVTTIAEFVGPDTLIPVVVTDLTEQEARKALAVKDPLSAMARNNAEKLDALMSTVDFESPELLSMMADVRKMAEAAESDSEEEDESDPVDEEDDVPEGVNSPVLSFQLVFDSEEQQDRFYKFLRWLRDERKDIETHAARLISFINDHWGIQ